MYRHVESDRDFQHAVAGDLETRDAIQAHLEAHLGQVDTVLHELLSDLVHVDILVWRPTIDRPMYTLVTLGMSDRPMKMPRRARWAGMSQFAEVMLCLPAGWPIPSDPDADSDDDADLPIRSLKVIARLPHEYETFLASGHTVPNGDPPEPFTETTRLCAWVLMTPTTVPDTFRSCSATNGRRIDILGLVALHADELDLKLRQGADALLPGFAAHQVSELLDMDRPSSLADGS